MFFDKLKTISRLSSNKTTEEDNYFDFQAIEDLIETANETENTESAIIAPSSDKPQTENNKTVQSFSNFPFKDSLDTDFYYMTSANEHALLKLMMCIDHDISFALIHGESGTGKTILSQKLLEELNSEKYYPVLVPVTPNLTKGSFLKILLEAFNVPSNEMPRDSYNMIRMFADLILSSSTQGVKPVLLIDEAHFLNSESLHVLRTLSNFESSKKKLITTILFTESRILKRLSNPSYASLRNRIYLDIKLKPLDYTQTQEYIKFRLQTASEDIDTFSENEMKSIYEKSQGIPRNINKFAMNIIFDRNLQN